MLYWLTCLEELFSIISTSNVKYTIFNSVLMESKKTTPILRTTPISLIISNRFIAVTHEKIVQVWRAPGTHREFAPFELYRKFPAQYDSSKCIDWSDDSRYVIREYIYMCIVL